MLSKPCEVCEEIFHFIKSREETAKYCSRKCSDSVKPAKPNTICEACGKKFHIKNSQKKRYPRSLGFFCSSACLAKAKKVKYSGDKNPNWKNKTHDCDGYRLYVPQASNIHAKKQKLHHAVCCEILGVSKIMGFHIHHRDCDVENNTPENLAVMNTSDHKWIHQQYGVATLWAFMRGKVSLLDIVSWSDNKERAPTLLQMCVLNQTSNQIGIITNGELRGNLKSSPRLSVDNNTET